MLFPWVYYPCHYDNEVSKLLGLWIKDDTSSRQRWVELEVCASRSWKRKLNYLPIVFFSKDIPVVNISIWCLLCVSSYFFNIDSWNWQSFIDKKDPSHYSHHHEILSRKKNIPKFYMIFMVPNSHSTPGSHFRYFFAAESPPASFAAIGTQWTSMLSSESLGTGNSQWIVVDYNRPEKVDGWKVS